MRRAGLAEVGLKLILVRLKVRVLSLRPELARVQKDFKRQPTPQKNSRFGRNGYLSAILC